MVELIKMEFKSCYQKIGIALLGSMTIGLISILTSRDVSRSGMNFLLPMIWLFAMLAVVSMFVYNVVTSFTKRIFSHEGYLSLTLPVSSKELVLGKFIVQIIWLFFIFVCALILVALFAFSMGETFSSVLQVLSDIIRALFGRLDGYRAIFIIVTIVSFNVMSVWFFLTLMHTKIVRSKRVLVGLICWYIFNNLFTTLVAQIVVNTGGHNYYGNDIALDLVYGFIYLAGAVLFFMGITYLLDYHIELE